MLFEFYLKDFVWHSICQVGGWLVCFDMLLDYAASAFCKFYCNGCFPFVLVVLPLCDFFSVHFAGLVKKSNHSIGTLLRLGQLVFLACEAGCMPDVFGGVSVSFCVNPCGSSCNVATQVGPNTFVIVFLIYMPCGQDLTNHFCQLKVGEDPCWMFGRRAKCK